MSSEEAGMTVPAHHLVGMDLSFTCTNCGGHTSIAAPCIPAKTYPAPVPSEVAETTAGEREVEALLAIILAASPGTPTLTCRRIAEAIHASPLLDRVRREEGERIAQAIEELPAYYVQSTPSGGWMQAVRTHEAVTIARAASVGRGDA